MDIRTYLCDLRCGSDDNTDTFRFQLSLTPNAAAEKRKEGRQGTNTQRHMQWQFHDILEIATIASVQI